MQQSEVTTIGDVIRFQAHERGDEVAFTFEGDEMTYGHLHLCSNQAANGLISLSVKPGDRVAYMGKNSHLYFEILAAVAKVGAVMTPINWRLAPPEVSHIVNDCKARVLFIGPEFADLVRQLKPSLI